MRRPWETRLAWGLWASMMLLVCIGFAMAAAWGANDSNSPAAIATFTIAFVAFGTVGALVASRAPANALGWIFLAIGMLSAANDVVGSYAREGLVDAPGTLPAAIAFGWAYMWLWYVLIALIGFVPLLFPDGQLQGPRWRWVARALVGLVLLSVLGIGVSPGSVGDGEAPWPKNPLGIGALKGVLDVLEPIVAISLVLLLLASLISVIFRFRRSRGDERLQLKSMLYSVVVICLLFVVPTVFGGSLGDVGFALAIMLIPVAVGVAMLKYRLYDVDRVISKTLVYGALTVVLAGTYVGLVLAGQALFSSFAGGSNLAIAGSTLVVAALFLPVRSRVQRFVDRRFYRRRYDAQQTLESFGARLREQIELSALEHDLQGVVTETMQPAHVATWLRSGR